MYFLTSERIGFRYWQENDFELAMALWGDPAVTRFIDARSPLQPEHVRDKLASEMAAQNHHGFQYWPIFLHASGEHVGCCGLRQKQPAEGVIEFGVHLRQAWWGRGLAREAGRVVITYAFEHCGAKQLFAGHNPQNHGSRRLLLTLGFEHIGEEYYAPTGLHHPSYLLGCPTT